jgi:serine/threonine protein kinase
VPKELAAIVNRCLLKDPNDRFQSAAELASALLKFAPESARTPVQHASSMPPAFGPDVAKERRTDHEEICEFREARHEGFTASAQPSPSHSVVKHRQESRLTIDPIWSLADQHREHRPSQSWVKGALMAAVLATVALGYQLENRHPGHILEVARIHSHSAGGVR